MGEFSSVQFSYVALYAPLRCSLAHTWQWLIARSFEAPAEFNKSDNSTATSRPTPASRIFISIDLL